MLSMTSASGRRRYTCWHTTCNARHRQHRQRQLRPYFLAQLVHGLCRGPCTSPWYSSQCMAFGHSGQCMAFWHSVSALLSGTAVAGTAVTGTAAVWLLAQRSLAQRQCGYWHSGHWHSGHWHRGSGTAVTVTAAVAQRLLVQRQWHSSHWHSGQCPALWHGLCMAHAAFLARNSGTAVSAWLSGASVSAYGFTADISALLRCKVPGALGPMRLIPRDNACVHRLAVVSPGECVCEVHPRLLRCAAGKELSTLSTLSS